jgi:hypothetical protein
MAIIRITTGENSLPRAGSGTEGRVEQGSRPQLCKDLLLLLKFRPLGRDLLA